MKNVAGNRPPVSENAFPPARTSRASRTARSAGAGAKFAKQAMVVSAHKAGDTTSVQSKSIGAALVFGRLWEDLGIPAAIERLLAGRRFALPVERVLFMTVLHRLLESGSDRACVLDWSRDVKIPGAEQVGLHQAYRAMEWLGEPLPQDEQAHATPFAPRCVKDAIEEDLFARRRHLFTELELVFFDTTSISFEGEGGQTLGQYGSSKDHHPDCKQMVMGVVLDHEGRPLCCELWPGNVADVTTLVPVVNRLRQRFHISSVCIVADRGMISRQSMQALQAADNRTHDILGARLRSSKEVDQEVLSRPGRYRVVRGPRQKADDPSRGTVRRQMGDSDRPHRPLGRGRRAEVQGALDGRGHAPDRKVGARDTAHLPQVRRDDPRARLLQLSRTAASHRTVAANRRPGRAGRMGQDDQRPGGSAAHRGRPPRPALPVADGRSRRLRHGLPGRGRRHSPNCSEALTPLVSDA